MEVELGKNMIEGELPRGVAVGNLEKLDMRGNKITQMMGEDWEMGDCENIDLT